MKLSIGRSVMRPISLWALACFSATPVFAFPTPTQTEDAILNAPDALAGDNMGYAVDVDGDTAVVSARFDWGTIGADLGSVYVFVRGMSGWSQQAKIYASDPTIGDDLGHSLAISGDTFAAGAVFLDGPAGVNQGAAYIFVRNGTEWSEQAKLLASDAAENDAFGSSVDLDGDSLVVGAPNDDSPTNDQGSVYVFVRTGTVWTQQAKLLAGDPVASDRFGTAVAIHGNTLVAGAHLKNGPAGNDQGAAYVFVRNGTVWTQQTKIMPANAAASDNLGKAVAIFGERIAIGAPADNGNAGIDQGSVYVYRRNGTTWSQTDNLLAPDAVSGDAFGTSVSMRNEGLLIGAPFADGGAGSNSGAAYLFVRKDVWLLGAKLLASDAAAEDRIGFSCGLDDTRAIVGVYGDILTDGASSAYLYEFECLSDGGCFDGSVCTCNRCVDFACQNTNVIYGNVDCMGIADLDDLICCLQGFADLSGCVNADLGPECLGDGIVDVDDLLGVLQAFAGDDLCACSVP